MKSILHKSKGIVVVILLSLLSIIALGINLDFPLNRLIQQILKISTILVYLYFALKYFKILHDHKVMKWCLLFLLHTSIYVIISENRMLSLPFLYVQLISLFFYVVGLKNFLNEEIITIYIFLLIFVCILNAYFSLQDSITRFNSLENLGGDNTGYLLALILPFLFLIIQKRSSIIYLALIIIFVLLSRKRGAILSLIIPSILVFKMYLNINFKAKSKLFFIYLGVFMGGVCYMIYKYSFIFSHRFSSMDNGSGRTDLYSIIYNDWLNNSNGFQLLFGKGFYATFDITKKTFGQSLYAHSDIFEILYDFGIIGLSIYFVFFIVLLKQIFSIKRRDPIIFTALLSAVSIFIIKSIFSGIFFDFDCFVLMSIIGYLLGKYDFNVKHKTYQIQR